MGSFKFALIFTHKVVLTALFITKPTSWLTNLLISVEHSVEAMKCCMYGRIESNRNWQLAKVDQCAEESMEVKTFRLSSRQIGNGDGDKGNYRRTALASLIDQLYL